MDLIRKQVAQYQNGEKNKNINTEAPFNKVIKLSDKLLMNVVKEPTSLNNREFNAFNNTHNATNSLTNNDDYIPKEDVAKTKLDTKQKTIFYKTDSNFNLFGQIFKNKNVTVTKVNLEKENKKNTNNKQRPREDSNKDFIHYTLGKDTIKADLNNSTTMNKGNFNSKATKLINSVEDVKTNKLLDITHSNCPKTVTNKATQCVDELTKCLKEFEAILAEVQSKDDCKVINREEMSIDEMDDILNEVEDTDSTYFFQEIKAVETYISPNWSNINFGIEEKLQIKSNIEMEDTKKSHNVLNENSSEILIKDEEIRKDFNDKVKQKASEVSKLLIDERDLPRDTVNVRKNIPNNKRDAEKSLDINQIINLDSDEENEQLHSFEVNKNDDVISITSESSTDCGYNSSDFELITEEEAKMDGLIVNFKPDDPFSDDKTKNFLSNDNSHNGSDPSKNSGRIDYRKNYKKKVVDKSHLEKHEVPQENEFLEMFRGYIPAVPCQIRFLENKSVTTQSPMLVQYEGIGFDMNLAMQTTESDEEYRDEAEKSRKKILQMYPGENTRKRRRR